MRPFSCPFPAALKSFASITQKTLIVEAPEFYAIRPLHNGFVTRTAKIRTVMDDGSMEPEFGGMELSDVDMDVWAVQFLQDFEALFTSEHVQRAGLLCPGVFDGILGVKKKLAEAVSWQLAALRKDAGDVPDDVRVRAEDRLRRSLAEGYDMDAAACYHLDFKAAGHIRLTAAVENQTKDCLIAAGKADTGKEEFCLFFTNQFRENARELHADIVFTELEYDIVEDGGYESSRWLRFITPFKPYMAGIGKTLLEFQVCLPNPLKNCPQSLAFDEHTCRFLPMGKKFSNWDYELDFHCCYKMQDTIQIRIEFESAANLKSREMAESWKDWNQTMQNRVKSAQRRTSLEKLSYSCIVRGERGEDGLRFLVESTEEGRRFLEQTGALPPEIRADENAALPDERCMLKFMLKQLPLYQCTRALPYISLIRNQNLLYDKKEKRYLEVSEEFIYRTPEISFQQLRASGGVMEEVVVGTVRSDYFGAQVIRQMADLLLESFDLTKERLLIELGVLFYYGLEKGQKEPRIVLPVTFLPLTETGGSEGEYTQFGEGLKQNLTDWFEQKQPDTNCCGFLFHLKLYEPKTREKILYFPKLNVGFIKE